MKIHRSPKRTAIQAAVCALAAALSGGASAFPVAGSDVSINGRVVGGIDATSNVAKSDGTSGTVIRAASNQWARAC